VGEAGVPKPPPDVAALSVILANAAIQTERELLRGCPEIPFLPFPNGSILEGEVLGKPLFL